MAYADFTAEELGRPMSEEEKVYQVHNILHYEISMCNQMVTSEIRE